MEQKSLTPDDTLYIYYINGTVGGAEERLAENVYFHGNWVEGDCSFLFFSSPADTLVKSVVKQSGNAVFLDRFEMTLEQWHGERTVPYEIGGFCVSPPWDNSAGTCKERHTRIILDPGVVFGTGRHRTTQDCLVMLTELIEKERVSTLLDIGTGTGLLSLTAAALGLDKIIAGDANLLAVKTAANNIRLNAFENRILPVQAKGEALINTPADAVVANIHYDAMKDIIEEKGFLEKKWFILSGILKTETGKILSRLDSKGAQTIDVNCPDGVWHTILGKSNG